MVTFNATTKKSLFRFRLPDAQTVSVVGEFNQWDPEKNVMKKGKGGDWECEIRLAPGSHQFLYFADRIHWITDDACPKVMSDVGTENSLITVVAAAAGKKRVAQKKPTKKK